MNALESKSEENLTQTIAAPKSVAVIVSEFPWNNPAALSELKVAGQKVSKVAVTTTHTPLTPSGARNEVRVCQRLHCPQLSGINYQVMTKKNTNKRELSEMIQDYKLLMMVLLKTHIQMNLWN